MHDQITTTTTTDETIDTTDSTIPPRTLDEILAARTRKLERDQRELAEQTRLKTEGRRQDALTAFTVRYEQMFPQSLRDALAATIGYDTTPDGSPDPDDPGEPERGPYATFEHDGQPWTIRRGYYYRDDYWLLDGPNNYHAQLSQDWDWSSPAGPLLDALNAYPQWLDDKQQREREKAEKAAAAKAAQPQQEPPTPYAYIAGDDPGHHGFLNTNARVWIKVETPETGEYGGKTETIHAQVIDWDAQWLLINEDDDETSQRLIPIARVVSIQPRA